MAQEQERRREAERRLAAHAARAAENNTALARKNLRLQARSLFQGANALCRIDMRLFRLGKLPN